MHINNQIILQGILQKKKKKKKKKALNLPHPKLFLLRGKYRTFSLFLHYLRFYK